MSLQHDILRDLQVIEHDLGEPTFTMNGTAYNFIPSTTDFSRENEKGGFEIVKLMTATVRLYDIDFEGNLFPLFASLPSPQFTIIKYNVDGLSYRVESIKRDPTNSYFRLVAHSTLSGI